VLTIHCFTRTSWLKTSENKSSVLLLTVKDITSSIINKNLVIRAMIETEEKERRRLARDLHDSFGQQLSAIKFYISALASSIEYNGHKEILLRSNDALNNMHADMRSICFNLTSKTLEEFGLLKAVHELGNQIEINESVRVRVRCNASLPPLPKGIETDIFRVIQEFINNSLRHGKADKILILFEPAEKTLSVKLKDNGIGFNIHNTVHEGLGLQNVQSRVKSHGGKIKIISNTGKGTQYHFFVPINA
jgi:signal transduction histidine kinase